MDLICSLKTFFCPVLSPYKQILSLSHIEEQQEAPEYYLHFVS